MATTPEETAADVEARAGASEVFKKTIICAIAGKTGAAATAAGAVDITTQFVSLHNAPGGVTAHLDDTSGPTTELPAGTYARQPLTWGAVDTTNSPLDPAFTVARVTGNAATFNVDAGTITHYGVWTAATGGTFLYAKPISAQITLSAPGKVTVTPTHSFGMSV